MAALFGFSGGLDPKLLRGMSDVLRHRGGMVTATDAHAAGALGFHGHHEPALTERLGCGLYAEGPFAVALAGYLTNASKLTPILPSLLRLFREEGPSALNVLRGAFVLALREEGRFHLLRDCAGARTIYYGVHADRFLFASEPKAILATPGFPRRILPAAVARFLTFSFQPGPQTMLEHLHEVPAGHLVTWAGGREPQSRCLYPYEESEPIRGLSDPDWIHTFREGFQQSVAARLNTGDPVGVFLSGGIDSSIVAAEVARQRTGAVKTFAIHFGDHYPNELPYARMVAKRCNTEHEEVLVRPKHFLPRLRNIIWHLDDPIGDPVAMPNFELARHAARSVRWVFNGEGGDPLFGGPKNIPMLLHHWYGGVDRGPRFRERKYLASYQRAYDDIKALISPEWLRRIDMERDLEGILTPFFEAAKPRRFLEKLLVINARLKGAHLILPKVERMLGAWGLTPLSPLFDERLIQMAFEMPSHLKLWHGIEKIVLKRAYQHDLPAEIIARPKSGMRVPVHYWFRGEMRRYARHILSPRRVRQAGIFNADRIKQLLDYDLDDRRSRYGLRLWMLITFEIWRRIVVEGEAP